MHITEKEKKAHKFTVNKTALFLIFGFLMTKTKIHWSESPQTVGLGQI